MTDRKDHWQRIYRDKDPREVSWFQIRPECSLALIGGSGIDHDAPIIDVGGGASRLADCLVEEGYARVSVLDVSRYALECARERMGAKGDSVEWIEADITAFDPPHEYTLWHDRAVFHFLTEKADRSAYMRVLKHGLHPHGFLVIAAFAIGGPRRCSGLDIVQYDAEKLMAELGGEFHLLRQEDEIHITPEGKEQRFSYFFFRRDTASR